MSDYRECIYCFKTFHREESHSISDKYGICQVCERHLIEDRINDTDSERRRLEFEAMKNDPRRV